MAIVPRSGAVHQALAEPSRRRLLELLEAVGRADAHELAGETGLHPTTVRSHMDRLIEAGLVAAAPQRRGRRGRPRKVYTAVPNDTIHGNVAYREMAGALVEELARRDAGPALAVAAGRAWGQRLAGPASHGRTAATTRARLVDAMRALGFGPSNGQNVDEIILTACPLLEVATRHPDIVCALHRGLLESLVDEPNGPLAVTDLLPFATPDGCTVELAARSHDVRGTDDDRRP